MKPPKHPKAVRHYVVKGIMHKINAPPNFKSERQPRAMTKKMTERWPFSWFLSSHRHIPTEKDKMASLLSRNHSFSLLLLLFLLLLLVLQLLLALVLLSTAFFQSLAHFMSANTKPSGTMGDTQETMTISATCFRGSNRFIPLLIWQSDRSWEMSHFLQVLSGSHPFCKPKDCCSRHH